MAHDKDKDENDKKAQEFKAQALKVQNELREKFNRERQEREAQALEQARIAGKSYDLVDGDESDEIVKAYKEKFGPKYEAPYTEPYPSNDPKIKGNVLCFPSREDTKNFFNELAEQSKSFLCVEHGKGYEGHNFFSCGNGHLYEGSLKGIHETLSAALKTTESATDKAKLEKGIKYLERLAPELKLESKSDEMRKHLHAGRSSIEQKDKDTMAPTNKGKK